MKVAIAQINTIIGDFEGNTAKIIDRINWAKLNGADLVVFPEMAITGYPPKDLLDKPYFIKKNLDCLETIAVATDNDIAAVVGVVAVNEATTGKGLFNSAAFLSGGEIVSLQHKTLLPTYDIFDEGRYFEPGQDHSIIEYKGEKVGVTVCEDIWYETTVQGRQLYSVDPVKILAEKGADFIINISSSPYIVEKRKLRESLLSNVAKRYKLPIVYVNSVGGNDELVFDGCSLVVSNEGKIIHECGAFVEDAHITDLNNLPQIPSRQNLSEIEEVYEALVLGVRDYIKKCGFEKVVIGLSGGIDSALVAAIAADAIGAENVLGITMPTRFSSSASYNDSKKLADNLGINFKKIAVESLYQSYLDLLDPEFDGKEFDATEENIQARIRGNILMAFSNKFGAIVLSTGNKSELAVGYCTLYGDMSGGLAVISDVPKTLVYKLSEFINRDSEIIPRNIIDRPPSAELRPDQTDQDELPPYEVLDEILKAYVEDHIPASLIAEKGFDLAVVKDVIRKIDRNEYKRRQAAPGLKITSKSFGWGRWQPIACKY